MLVVHASHVLVVRQEPLVLLRQTIRIELIRPSPDAVALQPRGMQSLSDSLDWSTR